MDFDIFTATMVSKSDGYESVWSKNFIDCDVDSFMTEDTFLEKFLGISDEYPYVLLKLKDNVTNFDTYVWDSAEWNTVTPTGDLAIREQINTLRSVNATPKLWRQPTGENPELNLTYAPNTFNKTTVNVILYYMNSTKAAPIAQLFVETQQQYPDINFYCWDLMIADAPKLLQYSPSVGIYNYKVHDEDIVEIQQPFDLDGFVQFIDANVGMVDFYDSLPSNADKKRILLRKEQLQELESKKEELQGILAQLKVIE